MTADVFRCDYCGQLGDIRNAVTWWTTGDQLDDGSQLHCPAVYCSDYCGRRATTAAGSGRG